ncbi:hypothetical protein [Ferrovum sp. PN-J185]|uniref:hypothetical protein n=1 Tax=Ferrovum sp. PN-J185 TaxID=1356306 RepID=UPI0007938F1F|nr:hypothetical protein [Ferrovum sp. PN-J185]KXW55839.1 hypothetical protein FV185_09990 [Ferrovum sp. PN-J185]
MKQENDIFLVWDFKKTAYFILALVLLVAIRITYWSSINETPFSDMADYIFWGKRWSVGDWMMKGQFWGAYKPPGVPLLYASIFYLTNGFNIEYLKWMQLIILVLSLTLLSVQLFKMSGTFILSLLLILVVAFSKSSVFWSFKVGTESLAESMIYLSLGVTIWVYRDNYNPYKYLVLALVTVFSTFIRPNLLPLVVVLVLLPLFKLFSLNKIKAYKLFFIYILTVICLWSPWIVRNYVYCGQFVPLSTQGPYTFIWELGRISLIEDNGQHISVHVNQLQADASKRFINDCQANRYAMGLVKLWIKQNIKVYPELIFSRLVRYATDRQIDLTHISRFNLNPWLDRFLFDKSQLEVVFSLISSIILSFYFVWARIIASGILATILFSSLFLGDARMFEPFIPISIFMLLAPVIPLWKMIKQRLESGI